MAHPVVNAYFWNGRYLILVSSISTTDNERHRVESAVRRTEKYYVLRGEEAKAFQAQFPEARKRRTIACFVYPKRGWDAVWRRLGRTPVIDFIKPLQDGSLPGPFKPSFQAPPPKYTKLEWDRPTGPALAELQKALRPLGLYVYEDPAFQGEEIVTGFVLSKDPLSKEALNEIMEDDYVHLAARGLV